MTKSEGQKPTSYTSDLRNTKTKLPWWVELLFVQLGLPEKHLSTLLKFKNEAKNHFENNHQRYMIVFLAFLSISYLNPVVRYSRDNNICTNHIKNLLRENYPTFNNPNINSHARAVNYCRGGMSLD